MLIAIVVLITLFFAFDLQQYLTLEFIKAKETAMLSYYQENPLTTVIVFILAYLICTGLSLPFGTAFSLTAGGIFGLWLGVLLISFCSAIGASLAFLSARFLFRDTIQKKFGDRLKIIDEGLEKEGVFYLFTLRLIPIFPYFMINLLMGLTTMKLRTFYWVSQLGMLLAVFVFVNAGTQLAKLESYSDILSAKLIGSFVLLGLLPLLTKIIIDLIKRKKQQI